MAARSNGSRVVIMAVTGTLAAIGVGSIYLPFIADKDKVRGLHEESELDERSRREYQAMLRQMGDAQEEDGGGGGAPSENTPPPPPPPRPSNSMWSRMKRNS